jgi:polar amino acid transport system substrate-binding protein
MPRFLATMLLAAVPLLISCQYPRDPDGTLDRVSGGTLRVGFTVNEPWVELPGDAPQGIEPELVRGLARELDAQIDWTEGSEEDLVGALEEGQLDLVIGGVTDKTQWTKMAALSRPYVRTEVAVGTSPGSSHPDDFGGETVSVEAGDAAAGLVLRKTDARVERVQSLATGKDLVATDDFLLDDLKLQKAKTLEKQRRIMLMPLGENAWLVHVERYLLSNKARTDALLDEAQP